MSSAVSIQPLQWEILPDINNVVEFSESDAACFREIRDVLRRYNSLDRFGLTLLHSHFDVADGEVLLETTDVATRTQVVKPVPKEELNGLDYTITNWKLSDGDDPIRRVCVCTKTNQGHTGAHGAR